MNDSRRRRFSRENKTCEWIERMIEPFSEVMREALKLLAQKIERKSG